MNHSLISPLDPQLVDPEIQAILTELGQTAAWSLYTGIHQEMLAATLRSLEAQGVPIVVVIVDDGSRVPVVVHEEPSREREIVVLRHDLNRGIEHALNTGLEYIGRRGIRYVARLDNGDRIVFQSVASHTLLTVADFIF